jgi:hypothetical protein
LVTNDPKLSNERQEDAHMGDNETKDDGDHSVQDDKSTGKGSGDIDPDKYGK